MRATIVRTQNNDELVIPNQTFFTASFKTYTGTDKTVRVPIPFRTDCATPPRTVIDVLIQTAAGGGLLNSHSLDNPPRVIISGVACRGPKSSSTLRRTEPRVRPSSRASSKKSCIFFWV